jgi:hypothetical protein
MNIPQLSEPACDCPRGPPCLSYSPNTNPWSMRSHLPAMAWRDGSGTASGIQVVPDPIRSIDTPSGSGTIAIVFDVSCAAIPGIDGIAFIELSLRPPIPGIVAMLVSRPRPRIPGMFGIDAVSRDESGFMLRIACALSRVGDIAGIPGIESFIAPRCAAVESRMSIPGIFAVRFATVESVA